MKNPRKSLKLVKLALDGIFSFTDIPLRIATISGLMISGGAIALIVALFVKRLPVSGVSLIAVLVLFFGRRAIDYYRHTRRIYGQGL